jgi:hypothetical protein
MKKKQLGPNKPFFGSGIEGFTGYQAAEMQIRNWETSRQKFH